MLPFVVASMQGLVEDVAAAVIACGFFGGPLAVYYAWRKHQAYRLYERAIDGDLRRLDDTGFVVLDGTVAASDAGTLTSPVARDDDAVLAAWRIEEYRETGDASAWMPVASGVVSEPFELDDGTGSVRVDVGSHVYDGPGQKTPVGDYPEGVTLDGEAAIRVEFDRFPRQHSVAAGDAPPEPVRSLLDSLPGVDAGEPSTLDLDRYVGSGREDGDRRYYEATVEPGDDVELLGYATARTESRTGRWNPVNLVVGPPPGTNPPGYLHLSTRSDSLGPPSERYRHVGALGIAAFLLALAVGYAAGAPFP